MTRNSTLHSVQQSELPEEQNSNENAYSPLPNTPVSNERTTMDSTLPHHTHDLSLDPTLLTPIELEVQKKAAHSRQKMIAKHSRQHRIEIFAPGDLVSLAVPREDRASTDPLRLLCRVLKVKYNKSHQLQCQHGILN